VPTTATPTPSVDPVIAKIPAAARPETEAGASAFARYYFDALNKAATRPDPGLLQGLYGATCKTCAAMHDSVADLKRAGQRHAGPTIRVVRVSTDSFVEEKRVLVVEVDQAAVDVVDSAGKKVDRTIAAKGAFALTLSFDHGHWLVSRLQTVTA
jgi:hypothetical protein